MVTGMGGEIGSLVAARLERGHRRRQPGRWTPARPRRYQVGDVENRFSGLDGDAESAHASESRKESLGEFGQGTSRSGRLEGRDGRYEEFRAQHPATPGLLISDTEKL